jgi:hypothetical protein
MHDKGLPGGRGPDPTLHAPLALPCRRPLHHPRLDLSRPQHPTTGARTARGIKPAKVGGDHNHFSPLHSPTLASKAAVANSARAGAPRPAARPCPPSPPYSDPAPRPASLLSPMSTSLPARCQHPSIPGVAVLPQCAARPLPPPASRRVIQLAGLGFGGVARPASSPPHGLVARPPSTGFTCGLFFPCGQPRRHPLNLWLLGGPDPCTASSSQQRWRSPKLR